MIISLVQKTIFWVRIQLMKRILLLAGIHGDEPSGPRIILESLPEIQKYNKSGGVNIDIMPAINPYGLSRGIRENKKGKDLNRWFFDNSKKESRWSAG